MYKFVFIVFVFLHSFIFGQISKENYSNATKAILLRFDSLLCHDVNKPCDDWAESKRIGEGSSVSMKYALYAELIKCASEKELLQLLDNSKELVVVRAYAYMAYALKCDNEKRKEKALTYQFNIKLKIGCKGSSYSFSEFKQKVRVRNLYNPVSKVVFDKEEKQVIKKENQIRQEQGEPLREE